tara:strand:- start:78 stop:233 length:156 start_codon:yes stop_codon:yes gene_type:complete
MCNTHHTQTLVLDNNQIGALGDAGVTALADACAGGAMAAGATIYLSDTNLN